MKKNVLIYGLGVSGKAVEKFYKKKGISPFLFDDSNMSNLIKESDLINLDLVVVSPGVDEERELYQKLEEKSIEIISELELGFQKVKGKVIAITGTNGKTTTVSLLGHILSSKSKNSFVAGNIGKPLISLFGKTNKKSKIVCEVSSFQLMKVKKFSPKISAILNLAPDHLSRHKAFEKYIEAKCQIFKNQTKRDLCVLNYDDKNIKKISEKIKARKLYFSTQNQGENSEFVGVFVFNEQVFFKSSTETKLIMSIEKVKLIGKKNLENVICAVLVSILCGVKREEIESAVNCFLPLAHRLEIVLSTDAVTYVNDSKATNVASAIADIRAFNEKIVLLAGGSDKGEDFKVLFKGLTPNVCRVLIYGETKEEMKRCAEEVGYSKYVECESFEDAVAKGCEVCQNLAKKETKSVLLLSPACASFDEFKNYEERGNKFKRLIKLFNS